MRSLLAAFHFLTVLPLPGSHHLRDKDWGRATAWYPAVGLVLGAILAALAWGLYRLWPGGVAAALLLLVWMFLTGALHLDGFVDCCDALLAPVPRERRLEILHDVHVGAFGLVGVVLLLLLKYSALVALPAGFRLPALLLIPVLGRWGMTGAVLLWPYARPGAGLGRKARTGAGRGQLAIATLTMLVVVGLAWWAGLGWVALALVLLTAGVTLIVARWMASQLGGLTGDAYGALCELTETANLLVLVALTHTGVLA